MTEQEAAAFLMRHNGKRNLYYSLNPVIGVLNKKASKEDIAAIEYLHAELDPRKGETPEQAERRYLEALDRSSLPKPTATVRSGNGVQMIWLLAERI
jgi:hypothetical protein